MAKKKNAEQSAEQQAAAELVRLAKEQGLSLTGPDRLLKQLTKTVLETALNEEMTEHLGYEKHDPAGAGTGNIRNGTRGKTVLTENTGQVEIEVPRDRAGTFEPQIVKKRQRRLNGVDEIVLSLYAKGLTTGEISAHFAEIYGGVGVEGDDQSDHRQVIRMATGHTRRPPLGHGHHPMRALARTASCVSFSPLSGAGLRAENLETRAQEEVADPMRSSSREVLSRRELLQHGARVTGGLLAVDALGLLVTRSGAAADPTVGPPMPRTRLTDAAERLLRDTSPQFLIDHCHRSVDLAELIVGAGGINLDAEVLIVGILLHDLGLTSRFHSSQVRFEVASANAARDLARSYGMSPARAEKVWDVAALHATGGISDFKSPETAVGSDAIGRDVIGYGLDEFDPDIVARIMATRQGFAEPFIQAIVTDLQDKYQVASSTWMTTIAAKYIPGFHQSDIEARALADPWENP